MKKQNLCASPNIILERENKKFNGGVRIYMVKNNHERSSINNAQRPPRPIARASGMRDAYPIEPALKE